MAVSLAYLLISFAGATPPPLLTLEIAYLNWAQIGQTRYEYSSAEGALWHFDGESGKHIRNCDHPIYIERGNAQMRLWEMA